MSPLTIRSARERLRWPQQRACRDRGCICRVYDGRPGYYTLDASRHALGYHLTKADALEFAERAGAMLA